MVSPNEQNWPLILKASASKTWKGPALFIGLSIVGFWCAKMDYSSFKYSALPLIRLASQYPETSRGFCWMLTGLCFLIALGLGQNAYRKFNSEIVFDNHGIESPDYGLILWSEVQKVEDLGRYQYFLGIRTSDDQKFFKRLNRMGQIWNKFGQSNGTYLPVTINLAIYDTLAFEVIEAIKLKGPSNI